MGAILIQICKDFILNFNMFQLLQHTLQLGGPALMYHGEIMAKIWQTLSIRWYGYNQLR